MNMTENEIKGLPLESKQKLVIELRGIQPGDKAYPNAKALIEFITGLKGKSPGGKEAAWEEPKTIRVKATENITVDGRDVKKEQAVDVYPWQHRALARFFESVTAAAAMIALLLMVGLSQTVNAAPYKLLQASVNGLTILNGGTNNCPRASTNYFCNPVYTTNVLNLPVVTQTNGTVVITTNTINVITTNNPAVFNVTPYDVLSVESAGALSGAGTANTTITTGWNWSADGANFQTNAFTLNWNVAGTGTYATVTNIFPAAFGYLQLNYIANTNASLDFTNANVCIGAQ